MNQQRERREALDQGDCPDGGRQYVMWALLEHGAQGLGISQESSCMYNNFGQQGYMKGEKSFQLLVAHCGTSPRSTDLRAVVY